MKGKFLGVCMACVFVHAMVFETRVFAQTPQARLRPSLADSLEGEARNAYEASRNWFQSGDFKRALEALARAQKLSPDPRIFWNMAACEKKLGHYARASVLVTRYATAAGAGLAEEEREEAAAFVAAMRTLVASVSVASSVDGVALYIDDELRGMTPFAHPILVDSGVHRVWFSRVGYTTVSRIEVLQAADSATWILELPADVHEGRLVITVANPATIWLDGRKLARGEWGGSVASGVHTVVVTELGESAYSRTVTVRDHETRAVDLRPPARVARFPWLWLGVGVLAAAGATIGGYFIFRSQHEPAPVPRGTLGTFFFP
jgi:hypothetical protein